MLTKEKIWSLAKDDRWTFSEGKKYAHAQEWIFISYNEKAVWGEIKGRKQEPYQTLIDLTTQGTFCTCISHPYPCKHVVGLGLLFVQEPEVFTYSQSEPALLNKVTSSGQKPRETMLLILELVLGLLQVFI